MHFHWQFFLAAWAKVLYNAVMMKMASVMGVD